MPDKWHLTTIAEDGMTILAHDEQALASLVRKLTTLGVPRFNVADNRGGDGGWTVTVPGGSLGIYLWNKLKPEDMTYEDS